MEHFRQAVQKVGDTLATSFGLNFVGVTYISLLFLILFSLNSSNVASSFSSENECLVLSSMRNT